MQISPQQMANALLEDEKEYLKGDEGELGKAIHLCSLTLESLHVEANDKTRTLPMRLDDVARIGKLTSMLVRLSTRVREIHAEKAAGPSATDVWLATRGESKQPDGIAKKSNS